MNKIYILAIAIVVAVFAYFKSNVSASEGDDTSLPKTEQTDKSTASKGENASEGKQKGTSSAEESQQTAGIHYELPAPLTKDMEQIIQHTGYTLSYNRNHNTPNWSAWELTKEHTEGTVQRSGKFWADPQVDKRYRVDWYEYRESGYDRGHMCPAADMKWSADAMHDCFYMTNMCPQEHGLNNGSWKKLEDACRTWAINEGSVYIVCGPLYKSGVRHEQIGIDHAIDVPEEFFKAVLSLRKGHEKAIAFRYENKDLRQPMSKMAMSVDDLEKITGFDFFYQLDDALEGKVESTFNIRDWF